MQGGPLMHVIAGKAVCFGEALQPAFKEYVRQVVDNAKALAEVLLAGGVRLGQRRHRQPPDAGRRDAAGLDRQAGRKGPGPCGITVNKNMIPFDQRKPMDPRGIRIGTPALTTRGMKESEMRRVGAWILEVLRAPDDKSVLDRVRKEIGEFTKNYPVPGITNSQPDKTLRVDTLPRAWRISGYAAKPACRFT